MDWLKNNFNKYVVMPTAATALTFGILGAGINKQLAYAGAPEELPIVEVEEKTIAPEGTSSLNNSCMDYEVMPKETLSEIGEGYGIPWRKIRDSNGLPNNNIKAGMTLKLCRGDALENRIKAMAKAKALKKQKAKAKKSTPKPVPVKKSEPLKVNNDYNPNIEEILGKQAVGTETVVMGDNISNPENTQEFKPAYEIPTIWSPNSLFDWDGEKAFPFSPNVFNANGQKLKVSEITTRTLDDKLVLNEDVMENYNVYKILKGIVFEYKNDRMEPTFTNGMKINDPKIAGSLINNMLEENSMNRNDTYVSFMKRGSALSDRVDYLGFKIGPIAVKNTEYPNGYFVEANKNEKLTMTFKREMEALRDNSSNGNTGGGDTSNPGTGGPNTGNDGSTGSN